MPFEPKTPWWHGAAIYQIYPLSFADSNGDGWGDLPGVIAHLDYVASLGVDAIWLSPFCRSPMRDFGYDVADHTAVDPLFGTIEDADALIARAHHLGLKVILDQVWSHTSDQHAWFKESATNPTGDKGDWYVWADPRPDGMPPNNWLSVFGGSAWTWEPRRRQYYLHHFLASQPKLNLRNPPVLDAILATGRFWLDRGVDGFRLDAVDFMAHDPLLRDNPALPPVDGKWPLKPFALQRHEHDMLHADALAIMARIRALTDEYPGTVTLGEVSSQPGAFERIADYTEPGRLHLAYTLRLLRGSISAEALEAALGEARRAIQHHGLCWAFGNHDVVRLASRWASADPAAERAFMTLLGCLPGPICLYQGDELGLPEAELAQDELRDPFGIAFWPEFRGRDGGRTPMPWRETAPAGGFTTGTPWLPVPAAHRARAVDRQEQDTDSALAHWRGFLKARKARPALLRGTIEEIRRTGDVLSFVRRLGDESVLCAFNLSQTPQRFDLAGWSAGEADVLLPAWGTIVLRAGEPVPIGA
ncbi:alpha-glucosidase [Aliidongia dinghuensis]|uniref:Alpha-glucosidase n=1 Tax=Aliidongia dinghuensis TaxID=1867774 RepID=A0A8J2YQG6_9PROT|nr:alpha-glucosidase [Aliidongia dinghuensis]GGF04857.1 alpha-glucosidase [Aliidongia dinghuensis]